MSAVVSEFRAALSTAVANPAHALLVAVATVLIGIVGVVAALIPLIGPLANGVVFTPLLLVATLGSAYAVRHGGTAFDGARAALTRSALDVMGAYALLTVLYLGVSILAGIVFVGVILAGGMSGAGELSGLSRAVTAVAVVLGLALMLLVLAVAMAVQFVAPAAVAAGTGPVESLKTSVRFFRANLLGVIGFSLLLAGFGVVAVLGIGLFYVVGQAIDPTVGVVAAAVGYLGAVIVIGTFTPLYQLGYFETMAGPDSLPPNHEWPGDGDGSDTDSVDGRQVSGSTSGSDEEPADGFEIEMTGADTAEETENQDGNSWDDESR